ncbi:kinase-like protein [Lentinus tigrinus ALCF2SS1-7]|uniref:Kinase-like protein n=1 Tax=Lentinus tigrinus ALCF2SS1-6 TaxID=1328759 RepID=A0A5C2RW34_9APHY|nr:kinase-like protein [Lentinus tigrinus ALCF2SS1-6]RPD71281.1 kinase-like protein [Lentinus tigrinus ALCF2SS1-7]
MTIFSKIARFFIKAAPCGTLAVDTASYMDNLIIEAVQVVVDASRHAQAEVDVHVRMWFGDGGDMIACHLEQLSPLSASAPLAVSTATCTTLVRRTSALSLVAVSAKYLPVPEFKLVAASRLLALASPQMPKLSAEDFQIFQLVGAGAQGMVSLALYKPNGRFYGLKMIAKATLHPHQLAFAFQEQAILKQLEGSSWFIQLRGSFEDKEYLYLVTDFYTGGDLMKKIYKHGGLTASDAKNLAAQLVLAIEELHKRRIVHRDIKPGNLLLTRNGELVVSDFGLSRSFSLTAEQQPWTIRDEWRLSSIVPAESSNASTADLTNRSCGTLGYAAPETCRGGPYSYSADVFSVGAVIFEMLHDKLPFGILRERREVYAVLEAMETQPIGVNEDIDADAHDLLLTMLDPNPARRATLDQVKAHPWFADVDWKKLAQREPSVPLRPTPGLSPFDGADEVSFGTPYGPGEAPYFWYDYFSPSLPTEVPTKKSLRKKRAAKAASTPTATTFKTREVPPALSAMFANPAPSWAPSPSPTPAFLAPPARSYAGTPTLCGSATTSATAVSYNDVSDVYLPSPIASDIPRTPTLASGDIGAIIVSPIPHDIIDYIHSNSDEVQFSSVDLENKPSCTNAHIPTLASPTSPYTTTSAAQHKQPAFFRRALMALRGVKAVRRCDDRRRRVDLLA